jgi:hypothetical protein
MFCSVMFGALAVFFIFTTTPPTTEVPKASSDILLGLNLVDLVTLVTLGGLVFVGLGLARPMKAYALSMASSLTLTGLSHPNG